MPSRVEGIAVDPFSLTKSHFISSAFIELIPLTQFMQRPHGSSKQENN